MLPVPLGEKIEQLFGCYVAQTYAMTESRPISANPCDEMRQLHSVGASAGPDIRICAADGRPLGMTIEGEVCVRGECVTKGYEYQPHMVADPNMSAFHVTEEGRLLRTGYKGVVDPATGYLMLSVRYKEIISRGEKISPIEVEQLLRRQLNDKVHDMVVFAVPHLTLGEVVGLAVVPQYPWYGAPFESAIC